MQTIKGAVAGIVALIACPCHLPLTVPLLLALTSGSALGLWLASHQWLIWGASFVLFLGGLALAANWLGQSGDSARCELPTRRSRPIRGSQSRVPTEVKKKSTPTHMEVKEGSNV